MMGIAVLDARRLWRSPGIWLAALCCTFALVVGVSLPWLLLSDVEPATGVAFMLGPGTDLLFPTVAMLATYGAIAGQRDTATLSMVLAQPYRRRDVLAGVATTRMLTMVAVSLVAIVAATVAVIGLYGMPPFRYVVAFTAITVVAVACYAAIGVAVSASVASRTRAAAVLLPGFVFAYGLWSPLLYGIETIAFDRPPSWFEHVELINPLAAYGAAANELLPPTPHLAIAVDDGGIDTTTGELVGGSADLVVVGLALCVLAAWTIGSLLFARWQLDRASLAA